MEPQDKFLITVAILFLLGFSLYTSYRFGENSSRQVCERMLQYEHDKTPEEASKLYLKELEREGR